MQLKDFLDLVNSGGGWVAILYIFFMHALPKIAPTYAKAINKNQSREDRLYAIIADTNTQNAKLTAALEGLTVEFRENNRRLEKLEDNYVDCKLKQRERQ